MDARARDHPVARNERIVNRKDMSVAGEEVVDG